MILADKIMRLRKKNGWSQEELADKLNVSRQAVSKWEGAQTTPDLEKILKLSNIFGVTTDFLLKAEIEDEEFTDSGSEAPLQKITLAEANEYLELRKDASIKIAIAAFLCIICIIPLLLMSALSEMTEMPIAENTAVGIGVVAIFPIAAIAVYMFIRVGYKSERYGFLEKEFFEMEYGVTRLVKDRQNAYRSTYVKFNYIGACICTLSPVPLLCGAFSENSVLVTLLLCVTVLVAGIGVILFIIAGVRWTSMQKLLKEGDYSEKGKRKSRISGAIATVYWLMSTAIYLGWSFLSKEWYITWVLWPIAGILFVAVKLICDLVIDVQEEK